jgi:hypothetical protein
MEPDPTAEGRSTSGKVLEPAYDPESGEMVIAEQGPQPASPEIACPVDSKSPATKPGHCAMPRAAGILVDEAAAAGRPRPNVQTTQGGHTIRGGEAHPIDACPNCRAIKNDPNNQIETVGPGANPKPPHVVPATPSNRDDANEGRSH